MLSVETGKRSQPRKNLRCVYTILLSVPETPKKRMAFAILLYPPVTNGMIRGPLYVLYIIRVLTFTRLQSAVGAEIAAQLNTVCLCIHVLQLARYTRYRYISRVDSIVHMGVLHMIHAESSQQSGAIRKVHQVLLFFACKPPLRIACPC